MKDVKINIIDKTGETKDTLKAKGEVFGLEENSSLVSQAVKAILSNKRSARAKTKGRSFVDGSTVKIWKQKGTGHARHGDRQAPIFVGGGVSHGPVGNQNYKKQLSKKMKTKSVFLTLSDKLRNQKVVVLEDFTVKKTKEAGEIVNNICNKLSFKGKGAILMQKEDENSRFFKNLKELNVFFTENLNSRELLISKFILISQKSFNEINK
jgi:large subunit ribosomal protein L4